VTAAGWLLAFRAPYGPPRLRVAAVCVVLVAALGVGYAGLGSIPIAIHLPLTAPGAPTLPVLPTIPVRFDGLPLAAHLERSEVTQAQMDEFLTSPVLRDPEFARAVHSWVRYWRVSATDWFPGFLTRMAWMGSTVDSALVTHGFPPSLRYLPLIESGYSPGVTSRARAVGLWQLMAPTARALGLEVDPLLDERRHPEKSTAAALRYLEALHDEFDSWFLTLAAYNSGPTRARGILRRHAPGVPPTDSLFWALRYQFPPETREFLPKLYGAMWVASQPEAYGYEAPTVEPYDFDAVSVPDQTTLDVVARAAQVPHIDIVLLNPEFIRGITPPDRRVMVRVPKGRGRIFDTYYPQIPPEARVSFVEHVVRSGETLSQIAGRYGVRVEDLQAANPPVRARSLPVGVRLTVPVAPSVRPTA
jgi:membrane-bound lytic murein transglycosylase D